MKLEFGSLALENFGAFSSQQTLTFARPGLHFLSGRNEVEPRLGSNGAGKSTLWNSLSWCLFGKTPGGLRNTDIKPWNGPTKTTVVVHVAVAGKHRVVARTANPNALTVDDQEIGQDDLDRLLGLSFETFTNTILLGQGRPLFFDLSPSAKMQLFAEVLDLERWERYSEAARKRAEEQETRIRAEEAKITIFGDRLEQITGEHKGLKGKADSWAADLEMDTENARQEIEAKRPLLTKAQARLNKAEVKQDSAGVLVNELDAEILKMQDRIAELTKEEMSYSGQAGVADAESHRLSAELRKLGKSDTCPTCAQSIKGTSLAKHKAEIEIRIKEEVKRRDAANHLVLRRRQHIAELNDKIGAYKDQRRAAKDQDAASDATILNATKTVSDLKAELRELEARIERLEKENNPYRDQVRELSKEMTKLRGDIEGYIDEKDVATQRMERAQFWIKGFKDIRLYVIDEVLQDLQLTTNAMLDEVGLIDWEVNYDIEKETKAGGLHRGLNLTITSPSNKTPVRWESWSGGEGQRLRLVGALALSEVLLGYAGVEPDLEILDEPTRHMSKEGVRDLCDFLADRARTLRRRIMLVDHLAIDGVQFSTVTTVRRTDKSVTIQTS